MSKTTVDHEEIRKWAESKGGKPASVDSTHKGDDVGIIRLMFPKSAQSEHDNLVEITWEEFFEQFEESGLALVYETDNQFSKLISRDGSEAAPSKKSSSPAKQESGQGDDLKSREYKDADGTIHHHTSAYMEKHAGEK